MNSCNDNCCQFWQKVPLMFLEGCCLNFQIYFYWLCFLFTVCCRFVILVPQNSLPTPQKCHLLEHIRGWHLRWLAFQLSLLLTLSILQKVFVEWFSIPAEVGYPHERDGDAHQKIKIKPLNHGLGFVWPLKETYAPAQ